MFNLKDVLVGAIGFGAGAMVASTSDSEINLSDVDYTEFMSSRLDSESSVPTIDQANRAGNDMTYEFTIPAYTMEDDSINLKLECELLDSSDDFVKGFVLPVANTGGLLSTNGYGDVSMQRIRARIFNPETKTFSPWSTAYDITNNM